MAHKLCFLYFIPSLAIKTEMISTFSLIFTGSQLFQAIPSYQLRFWIKRACPNLKKVVPNHNPYIGVFNLGGGGVNSKPKSEIRVTWSDMVGR